MKKNPETSFFDIIKQATEDLFIIWRNEMKRVVHDQGALIFFLLVPFLYPIIYAFIYTNETVREVPAVVVDESGSNLSREFVQKVDATPDVHVIGYCSDMEEARNALKERKAYGIIRLPDDFSRRINRTEQATVALYCDMSGLLYYKSMLVACTDASLEMNDEIIIERKPLTTEREEEITTQPLKYEYVTMFNPTNGFASFIIPAVLILIIQQTLLLGIGLINGSARERGLFHTHAIHGDVRGTLRLVAGKSLCYLMIYSVTALWLLIYLPRLFRLVQIPQGWDLLTFMIPFILASIFFAMTLSILVRQRETCMPLFVFTSLPLLFISGISWPGAAVPEGWRIVSWLFPSTFGINGFVRINSLGALLKDVQTEYIALWIQTGVYFLTACATYRYLMYDSRKKALAARKKEQEEQTSNITER